MCVKASQRQSERHWEPGVQASGPETVLQTAHTALRPSAPPRNLLPLVYKQKGEAIHVTGREDACFQ
jgi:hypothetical protein